MPPPLPNLSRNRDRHLNRECYRASTEMTIAITTKTHKRFTVRRIVAEFALRH